ncbi:hypothetical protein D9_0118 [Aeromonas phage D9]|nr:hypothetical protein D9_0118 [Aeromonas phage D9]
MQKKTLLSIIGLLLTFSMFFTNKYTGDQEIKTTLIGCEQTEDPLSGQPANFCEWKGHGYFSRVEVSDLEYQYNIKRVGSQDIAVIENPKAWVFYINVMMVIIMGIYLMGRQQEEEDVSHYPD